MSDWPGQALTVDPYSGGVDDPNGERVVTPEERALIERNRADPANAQPIRVNVEGGFPGEVVEELPGDAYPSSPDGGIAVNEQAVKAAGQGDLGGYLGAIARGLVSGLADLGSFASPGKFVADQMFGLPSPTENVNYLADKVGIPAPDSSGELITQAAAHGAGAAGPLGVGGLIAGAAGGAAGEVTKQAGYGEGAQLAAALAAGGVTSAAPALGARVAGVFGQRVPNAFLQAANRAGVADEILPADAGGPVTRFASGVTMETPFGAPSVIKQSQRLNDKAANIVANRAANEGVAQQGETLGDTFRGALETVMKSTRQSAARVYDRAAEEAGDAAVDLVGARSVVDDQIARLEATAQTGSIPSQLNELKALRSELERPLTIQGVRDMRTELFVAPDLRGTAAEARLKAITDAAAEDALNSLKAQGKENAAATFRQADQMWKDLIELIDKTIKPILGSSKAPKSSEQIVNSINASLKGNNARFAKFLSALPDEERSIARASILAPLGRDKDGLFSISRFADDWRDIGDSAKKALFGSDLVESLDALAAVGRQSKAAAKYGNFSHTGRTVITDRTVGSLLTGATAAGGLMTFAITAAGQAGIGRLLASPRFARWLASSAKKPNAAAELAHVKRLTPIAAAEPQIANEVRAMQQRLTEQLSNLPQSVAAQDKDDGR